MPTEQTRHMAEHILLRTIQAVPGLSGKRFREAHLAHIKGKGGRYSVGRGALASHVFASLFVDFSICGTTAYSFGGQEVDCKRCIRLMRRAGLSVRVKGDDR